MVPRAGIVLLVAVGALGVPGCADDRPAAVPGIPGKEGVGDLVAEAMADGIATLADYRAAVARFVACVEAAGHEVDDLRFIEASQLYDYRIPAAAAATGVDGGCYERELGAIDASWQNSPARPRGPGELRGLAPMLARCLDLHGIAYEGVVTERSDPAALEAVAIGNGLTLEECGRQVAASLGP